MIKSISVKLLIGAVLTAVLLNCSNNILVGVPVFVYSIFLHGQFILILDMFVYITAFVFMFFWIREKKLSRIYYVLLICIFLLANFVAEKFTKLDISYRFGANSVTSSEK